MAYVSQLEVVTTVDLGLIFSKIDSLGAILADTLRGYGEPVPEYRISGLKMH
jgi:hypothetical protein